MKRAIEKYAKLLFKSLRKPRNKVQNISPFFWDTLYKMLNRLELNFLLIDRLSTCLPVTTRQKSPRGDFAKTGSHWNYLGHTDNPFNHQIIILTLLTTNLITILTIVMTRINTTRFGLFWVLILRPWLESSYCQCWDMETWTKTINSYVSLLRHRLRLKQKL